GILGLKKCHVSNGSGLAFLLLGGFRLGFGLLRSFWGHGRVRFLRAFVSFSLSGFVAPHFAGVGLLRSGTAAPEGNETPDNQQGKELFHGGPSFQCFI